MKYWCRVLNRFASNTVYVGLSYYGPAMGNDEYLSFFLSGLVEIPGYLFCWAVMDRWGRRWPLCMLMVVGGLFCVATVLMPEGSRCLLFMKLKIENWKKKNPFSIARQMLSTARWFSTWLPNAQHLVPSWFCIHSLRKCTRRKCVASESVSQPI